MESGHVALDTADHSVSELFAEVVRTMSPVAASARITITAAPTDLVVWADSSRVVQVLGLPDPVAIAVQVPITVAVSAGYDWVLHGRVTRPVLAMLGFSVGLVTVMSAVLAVLFL